MKKNTFLTMLSGAAAAFSMSVSAEEVNKVWIEDFNISNGETKEISIMATNVPSVAAMQVKFQLPDGLTLVKSEVIEPGYEDDPDYVAVVENTDRLGNRTFNSVYNATQNSVFISIVSMTATPFPTTEGSIGTFKVTLDDSSFGTRKISASDIEFIKGDGTTLPYEKAPDTNVFYNIPDVTISGTTDFSILPGGTKQFGISVDNPVPLQGAQFDIYLPEGFSIDDASVEKTTRLSKKVDINRRFLSDRNAWRFILVDLTGDNAIRNAGDGEILHFNISAPSDFVGNTAINIKNVMFSIGSTDIPADDAEIPVINAATEIDEASAAAYEADCAKLTALIEQYNTAASDLEENYVGYYNPETFGAILADINSIVTSASEAYNTAIENHTPYAFEGLDEKIEALQTRINEAVANAKALKEVSEASAAAYEADCTKLTALIEQYNTAASDLEENYEGYYDPETFGTILADINSLVTSASEAYNTALENHTPYTFEGLDENIEALQTRINEAVENAKAVKEISEASAAAYEADCAKLTALIEQYNTAASDLEENYEGYYDPETFGAILDEINTLVSNASEAYNTALENQTAYAYEGLDEKIAALQARITEAVENAKALKEVSEVSATAYEADCAKLTALIEQYNTAASDLEENYEGYYDAESFETILVDINTLVSAVNEAYNTALENQTAYAYEGLDEKIAALQARITEAVANAKALKELSESSATAYEADCAKLTALIEQYNTAASDLEENYEGYYDPETFGAILVDINTLVSAVNEAYNTALENQTAYAYEGLDEKIAALQARITEAVANAKALKELSESSATAYEADCAKLTALNNKYNETIESIDENYPGCLDVEASEAIQAQIFNLMTEAASLYNAAIENSTSYKFEGLDEKIAEIEAKLTDLVEDAKSKKDIYDESVSAFEADMQKVNALTDLYNSTLADIENNYDGRLNEALSNEISTAINDLMTALQSKFDEAVEAGTPYVFEGLDEKIAEIEGKINELLEYAISTGIRTIEAEVANGELMIFTLDGKSHLTPVVGEVNIFVRKNGETVKRMVK